MKVRYEEYWNDFRRQNKEMTCRSLQELEDWMFGQMQRDYTKDPFLMFFPVPETMKRIGQDYPSSIDLKPERGKTIWIRMIEAPEGIIFSDGTFTSGQKYWTKSVREWLVRCEERKKHPEFNFAREEENRRSVEGYTKEELVRLIRGVVAYESEEPDDLGRGNLSAMGFSEEDMICFGYPERLD